MDKKVKVLIITLLIILCIVGFIACGYCIMLHITRVNVLKAVDNVFVALRSGDVESLKKYINLNNSDDKYSIDENNDDDNKNALIMLKDLNYEVVETEIGFKSCTIVLNVSNKNIKTVFSNYVTNLFSLALSSALGQITEEDMNLRAYQYLEDQYNSDEIEIVTNKLTINLIKEDGKWNVQYDKLDFVNAILPGYNEVLDSLNNISLKD